MEAKPGRHELGDWDLFCAADIKCVGEVSHEFTRLR